MKKIYLFLIFTSISAIAQTGKFKSEVIIETKLSCRAILVDDEKVWMGMDKGRYGFYDKKKDTTIITTKPINKDSAMVETVKDWNLERVYKDYLFKSDTLGTLEYNINVQYNRIKSFSYNCTPIYKEVTKER